MLVSRGGGALHGLGGEELGGYLDAEPVEGVQEVRGGVAGLLSLALEGTAVVSRGLDFAQEFGEECD